MNRTILITGASSGIGKVTTLLLARSGYHVFATVRKAADGTTLRSEAGANVTPILLDVTNAAQIEQAYALVARTVGQEGLMAIINNAGTSYTTPTESADLNQARALIEVHFWGMVAIVQQFLPLLRQYARSHPNQTRIINVSSVGGISAFPFIQFYNAAKFAVLGFTESLRFELNPFDIKAIAILPGSVKTEIWRKTDESLREALRRENGIYRHYLNKAGRLAASLEKMGIHAGQAALVFKQALEGRQPRATYLIGRDASAVRLMVRLLPDSWRHWLIRRQLKF